MTLRPLLLAVLLFGSLSMRANDLELVRAQMKSYYSAEAADPSAPRMEKALAELESVSRQITGPEWLRSDGSWVDIHYSGIPDGSWGPWDHTRRLIVLVKAWHTPGQGLYRDATLLRQIEAALEYTKTFYGITILPKGNWWFWTIGIPIDLAPSLVLMEGHVDQQIVDDLAAAIHLRIGNSPAGRGIVGPVPVGQNLVWSSSTHLCLALLKNDEARLRRVRDAMASVTRVAAAEGIKPDSSFHQHGAQLYTGGYGGAFANDVARYALITGGTEYALPADALRSFADYVADGIAWSLYGSYFDVSVISREVARSSTSGYNGLAALLQASHFDSPRREEIRAAATKMLATWNGTMPTELAALAARVEEARFPSRWPSGHRHYFSSDYTVHRRSGWFASVKMFSTRTRSGESTNGENLRGSRQSDGRFYLVQRGNEYFGRDVWPAFDWSRLPGTTVEQKADSADDSYGYGTRSLAGGTGDGRIGVSAMELAPLNSSLTARKSWFFFDDAIVFLTSGITSPGASRVETIVNQWPLFDPAAPLVHRSDWAVLEGVGYWFPTPVTIRTARERRSGTWAALGGSADTTAHTKDIVTMWIDHGASPVNAAAEYVIVPDKESAEMASWASTRPISIVANNENVAAARDLRSGALGIVFWRAASAEGIQSSAAAVVLLTGDGEHLFVDAADPNGYAAGTIEITLPGGWTTGDVPAHRGDGTTTLTIPRNGGRTTRVTLTRTPPKRRAVRR